MAKGSDSAHSESTARWAMSEVDTVGVLNIGRADVK